MTRDAEFMTVEVMKQYRRAGRPTSLSGQATCQGYMPLEVYADEAMGLFGQTPTPAEIPVESVKPLRLAKAQGSFPDKLAMLAAI